MKKTKKSGNSKLKSLVKLVFLPIMVPVWIIGWMLTQVSEPKQTIPTSRRKRRAYVVVNIPRENLPITVEAQKKEIASVPA